MKNFALPNLFNLIKKLRLFFRNVNQKMAVLDHGQKQMEEKLLHLGHLKKETEQKMVLFERQQKIMDNLLKQVEHFWLEHQALQKKVAELELIVQRDLDLKHLLNLKSSVKEFAQGPYFDK